MGKTLGYILIGVAVVLLILIAVLMFGPAEGRSFQASLLGFVLFTAAVVVPVGGAGIFFAVRGGSEAKQQAQVQQERKLLNMVKTQGQLDIADAVFELSSTRDAVQGMVYSLVGKGLFSGYINWDEGKLYSEQAAALHELEACRNCGGNLDLAGKGVIRCPYCDTEYFLDK